MIQLYVPAVQGPSDALMKTFGAIAAAQIALLPLSGAPRCPAQCSMTMHAAPAPAGPTT